MIMIEDHVADVQCNRHDDMRLYVYMHMITIEDYIIMITCRLNEAAAGGAGGRPREDGVAEAAEAGRGSIFRGGCVCIYIYIQREREIYICIYNSHIHIYVYMYRERYVLSIYVSLYAFHETTVPMTLSPAPALAVVPGSLLFS